MGDNYKPITITEHDCETMISALNTAIVHHQKHSTDFDDNITKIITAQTTVWIDLHRYLTYQLRQRKDKTNEK